MKYLATRSASVLTIVTVLSIMVLSACGKKDTTMQTVSGALSAIQTIDALVEETSASSNVRRGALLGIFVTEYLTSVPLAMASESALFGIGAQSQIITAQQTIQSPDYELLQAFGDALQVDIADLLNRSEDRQGSLETYTVALTNVATRANDRLKELESQLEELTKLGKTQGKDRRVAESELKKAIKDKDFNTAGEKQKALTDAQAAYAETDLQTKQLRSLVSTLEDLLSLYGKKIFAIQQNREALIAGIKVIDVPGADELQVLEKKRGRSLNSRSGYDSLFTDPIVQ